MGTVFRRWYAPDLDVVCAFPMAHVALVDAIIFLAPISGFDQVLAEDRTVNRLVRTFVRWDCIF